MTATNGHTDHHRHHPDFEHLAVFHDGPADLADRLAPTVSDALGRGEPVLVCLPTTDWSLVADQLGPSAAAVTCVPPDVRYERPGVAMAMIEGFASDAVAGGAPVA